MKFLTVSLTVLSLSASNLASQGKNMKSSNDEGYPDTITRDNRDKWNQRDMEMWQDNGRWRRDGRGRPEADYDEFDRHPRRGRWEDRRDRGSRRGDERRWNDRSDDKSGNIGNDSGKNGRRDDWNSGRDDGRSGNGNDKNIAPYPPTNPNPPHVIPPSLPPTAPSYPDNQQPNERDNFGTVVPPAPVMTTFLPPLPIIIEPIRSKPIAMPSIIEPYPEVIETETSYGSKSSVVYPTSTYAPSPSSSVYGPSTSIRPTSYAPVTSVNKKQVMPVYSSNTTVYASTVIMTEPEETVTTKVTGRYRAMSNSANNLAGSISFTIVLLSSVFLIALV